MRLMPLSILLAACLLLPACVEEVPAATVGIVSTLRQTATHPSVSAGAIAPVVVPVVAVPPLATTPPPSTVTIVGLPTSTTLPAAPPAAPIVGLLPSTLTPPAAPAAPVVVLPTVQVAAPGSTDTTPGAITVSLALPGRSLLATVDDIARVSVSLNSQATRAVVASQSVARSQMTTGQAQLHFSTLTPGAYTLTITAFDGSNNNIGTGTQNVTVAANVTSNVAMAVQLIAGGGTTATPTPIAATPTPTPTRTPIAATPTPTPTPRPTTVASLNYSTIFADGVTRGLAYSLQSRQLSSALTALSTSDRQSLDATMAQASDETDQIFILKALAAGEPWSTTSVYAGEIQGMADADVIAKSTMHGSMDLTQQWQDSCGPSVVEVTCGEYDPRYAFELHRLYQVSVVDPYGVNASLAAQQKQWLEAYGGVAVPRGQTGGKAIGIIDLLADHLTPVTHASYAALDATANYSASFEAMAADLNAGYAVPLRVVFVAEQYGHFVVALAVQGATGQHSFLIHDSVSGKTAWVSQANIQAENFNVFFSEPVQLSHYYQPTPK